MCKSGSAESNVHVRRSCPPLSEEKAPSLNWMCCNMLPSHMLQDLHMVWRVRRRRNVHFFSIQRRNNARSCAFLSKERTQLRFVRTCDACTIFSGTTGNSRDWFHFRSLFSAEGIIFQLLLHTCAKTTDDFHGGNEDAFKVHAHLNMMEEIGRRMKWWTTMVSTLAVFVELWLMWVYFDLSILGSVQLHMPFSQWVHQRHPSMRQFGFPCKCYTLCNLGQSRSRARVKQRRPCDSLLFFLGHERIGMIMSRNSLSTRPDNPVFLFVTCSPVPCLFTLRNSERISKATSWSEQLRFFCCHKNHLWFLSKAVQLVRSTSAWNCHCWSPHPRIHNIVRHRDTINLVCWSRTYSKGLKKICNELWKHPGSRRGESACVAMRSNPSAPTRLSQLVYKTAICHRRASVQPCWFLCFVWYDLAQSYLYHTFPKSTNFHPIPRLIQKTTKSNTPCSQVPSPGIAKSLLMPKSPSPCSQVTQKPSPSLPGAVVKSLFPCIQVPLVLQPSSIMAKSCSSPTANLPFGKASPHWWSPHFLRKYVKHKMEHQLVPGQQTLCERVACPGHDLVFQDQCKTSLPSCKCIGK